MTTPPGDGQHPSDSEPTEPILGEPGSEPTRPIYGRPGQDQPGDQPPGYGQQPPPYGPGGYPPSAYPPPGYGYAPPEHPRAMTSLVLGIVGLVICQVLSPFAWVIGKKAVNEIDASQGRLGGRGSAQAGYILGIVGTVLLCLGAVVFVIWLVLLVAIGTSATNA
jgi:hypothetical protein